MSRRWQGDVRFLLWSLVLRDFRVRYRNMSLGVFWSLANPLVMMAVLTFVFTRLFPSEPSYHFPLFVLCGLVPFNFFAIAWLSGTTSLVENAALVKRTRIPRELIPISAVLSNVLHLLIQIALLLGMALVWGTGPGATWLWLPLIVLFEVILVVGLALIFAALDVYLRDTRYLVESATLILFWLVPIVYPFSAIPERYAILYQLNPLAAVVFGFRSILIEGQAPSLGLVAKLGVASLGVLAAGLFSFARLKRRIYDYL